MATLIDGDLEGCGPSQPPVDRCQNRFTATTERSPPGNRPAMAAGRGNADQWRPGGLRSLAAAGGFRRRAVPRTPKAPMTTQTVIPATGTKNGGASQY
jgi:hypothetical protein